MSASHTPVSQEHENYQAELSHAISETRHAISEALGYIERQEDGPVTMRFALRDIEDRVSAIESEADYLACALDRFQEMVEKLAEQRDSALRQRDLLLAMSLASRQKSS
jgi:hypothetical protein